MTNTKYTPPFRVGRKQNRAVLDANGIEVVVFKTGDENLAKAFCEAMNKEECIDVKDSEYYFWKISSKIKNGICKVISYWVNKTDNTKYNYAILNVERP